MSECEIVYVGNERNGAPRYWCRRHFASAADTDGNGSPVCAEHHKEPLDPTEILKLDPSEYPGGVAIWGALPPVFSTAPEPDIYGVHVHARKRADPNSPKEIDGTYQQVNVCIGSDLLGPRWEQINTETAVAYFSTLSFEIEPSAIRCPHCQRLHLDTGIYAVRPHRKHLCQFCGRDFFEQQRGVGNPIVAIKQALGNEQINREVDRSPLDNSFSLSDFGGGIALWASNPAVYWTQPRNEHKGVHLHAYDATGRRIADDTFGSLKINGISLSRKMMRILMAQRLIPELREATEYLICPECGCEHMDVGNLAVTPHRLHECDECGREFQGASGRATIGNPLVGKLEQLKQGTG